MVRERGRRRNSSSSHNNKDNINDDKYDDMIKSQKRKNSSPMIDKKKERTKSSTNKPTNQPSQWWKIIIMIIFLTIYHLIIKSHMVRYLIYHIFSYIFIFQNGDELWENYPSIWEKEEEEERIETKNRQKKRLISDSLSLFQSILPSNRSFHWLVKEKEWEITIHFKMRFLSSLSFYQIFSLKNNIFSLLLLLLPSTISFHLWEEIVEWMVREMVDLII